MSRQARNLLATDLAGIDDRVEALANNHGRPRCDELTDDELTWLCRATAKGHGLFEYEGIDTLDSAAIRTLGYVEHLNRERDTQPFDMARLNLRERTEYARLLGLIKPLPPEQR